MDQVRRDDEEDDAFEYNSKVAKYSSPPPVSSEYREGSLRD